MSRTKSTNIPDLSLLFAPRTLLMVAVEHAVLRGHGWSRASTPVAEQIAVRLAGAITTGLVQAGQRLLEKDISAMLRVSRAPVREALRILERERLVEFQPRRGALVTAPDAKDMRDIYVVRSALYAIFLRRLMEQRPADMEAVFSRHMPALDKAEAEGSVDAFALANFEINMAMLELTDNRLVADLLASIALRTLRYMRLGLAANPLRMQASLKTWRAMQQAVARRDLDEVLATAVRRIDASRDAAVQALAAPPAGITNTAASDPARSQPSVPSRRPSAQSA
jgi:DNA-binding GntR family transcriptional regulator